MLNITNKLKIVSITEKGFKNIFDAKAYKIKTNTFDTLCKRVIRNITIVGESLIVLEGIQKFFLIPPEHYCYKFVVSLHLLLFEKIL